MRTERGRQVGLVAVIAVYAVLAVAFALRTPLWQAPDEPAHFNYVTQLAESPLQPPVIEAGDYPADRLEELKAARFPAQRSIAGIEYEDHQPPAYYYLAAAIYRLSGDLNADPVRAVRLFGVLLGAATVWLTWRVSLALVPGSRLVATGTAALVAFLPMHLTMVAAVNNDPLADVVAAAALLVALQYVAGRMPNGKLYAAGGALIGLAFWTKVTVVLPTVALMLTALGLGAGGRTPRAGDYAKRAALILGLGLVLAAPWLVRNALTYGPLDPLALAAHDAVVAGQPRTLDWIADRGLGFVLRRAAVFTFDSFWGVFGWMGVFLNPIYYKLLALVTLLAWAGAAGVYRRLRLTPGAWAAARGRIVLVSVSVASVALGFGIYNVVYVQHQGRYLFPALVPIAAAFTVGLREVARWSAAAAGAVVGGRSSYARARLARYTETVVLLGFAAALALLALVSLNRYIVPGLS